MNQQLAPEEVELAKKRRVLERLKDTLADREEEVTDLRTELDEFETRYTQEVAKYYAQLDEIEAQIAEEELKLVPDDEEIKKKVEELRRRAEESAAQVEEHLTTSKVKPTAEAKKAYHNLAKIIHPDLALDALEKARRHDLMARLNEAYSSGDQERLNKLVEDYRDSPEMISGDSIGDELVRVIRQIWQVRNRLVELQSEREKVETSELFVLRTKCEEEAREGRDTLKQMGQRTKSFIMKSERRLANLRNLNVAQEEYVKDKFGMDISDFRNQPPS